jgi:K+-sensing histidine kinase KdpD
MTIQRRIRFVLLGAVLLATFIMVGVNLLRPESSIVSILTTLLAASSIISGVSILFYLDREQRIQTKRLRAVSSENEQLYAQISQRADQLSDLNKISELLTETLSQHDVLDTIASSASIIADAHGVLVYLYDDIHKKWELIRQAGFTQDIPSSIQIPLSHGTLGNKNYTPLEISHLSNFGFDNATREFLKKATYHAVLELPIVRANVLEGVIGLYFNVERSFTEEYKNILTSFTRQVAYALHNAQTYETTDKALIATMENLRSLMDARETYTHMIVHDLRSPLTAVTTSLSLLNELVPKNSDAYPLIQRTTDISRRAIRKVLGRVDSMLDVAKMESGEMYLDREPAQLKPVVESVKTELMPLAQELNITLNIDIPTDLPLLDIDTDKIERMTLNLLDNALKYTPPDSIITLRARVNNTDMVRFDVIDQGQGVPDEYKNNLFDRFKQIEGRQVVRRGVGLGLSFCKLVAEAHGGKIWIEDNEGGGSIFATTLPIYTEPVLTKESLQ